jgi:uncharacterized membrane protein
VSDRPTGGLSETLPWIGLALLGLPGSAIAAYLTYSHWADEPTVCGGIGECELVQTSEYSDIAGVPVALLGLLFFLVMPVVALARMRRLPVALEWAQPVALSMALSATAFVGYLTYVELFVLEAICVWCVGLATITIASLAMTVWGAFADQGE